MLKHELHLSILMNSMIMCKRESSVHYFLHFLVHIHQKKRIEEVVTIIRGYDISKALCLWLSVSKALGLSVPSPTYMSSHDAFRYLPHPLPLNRAFLVKCKSLAQTHVKSLDEIIRKSDNFTWDLTRGSASPSPSPTLINFTVSPPLSAFRLIFFQNSIKRKPNIRNEW